jgi:hypothetical protein
VPRQESKDPVGVVFEARLEAIPLSALDQPVKRPDMEIILERNGRNVQPFDGMVIGSDQVGPLGFERCAGGAGWLKCNGDLARFEVVIVAKHERRPQLYRLYRMGRVYRSGERR